MKNPFYEKLLQEQKAYAKKSCSGPMWDPDLKIYVYHMYDGVPRISWWDDTKFKKGSRMVSVLWVHPRQKYEDLCDMEAYKVIGQSPRSSKDWLDDMTPRYKKLGKNQNRKKIVSYTSNPISDDESNWYKNLRETQKNIKETGNVVARCSFQVTLAKYARIADICIPIEVFERSHLKELADMVDKFIDNRVLFDKIYGNYEYNKENYLKDKENKGSEKYKAHALI